ncbi:AsmA family protein [Bradyrhizobium sp. STM 3557]|uniref:AsmA family protein n=1 Tax=Bradyrhizobium sp. STM 3557 TaxID=578920 RepID=UPI00388E52B8
MQTTLLGLAIAFILALLAALIGPFFVDWNQFRPQFEAEASQVIGVPVRVAGALDARLLPTPTLRLRQVTFGGANDLGKLRADKFDVEFSLGDLMRGEWRANELTIGGMAADLGLDPKGKVDLPAASGRFNLAALSIDRLNLTGRVALHDAASRSTLELSDIVFSGDVRSLAGSLRGDGAVTIQGTRFPFRVSSSQDRDSRGLRVHLNVDPGQRPVVADVEGLISFGNRSPHFNGALTLSSPPKEQPKDQAKDQAAKDQPSKPQAAKEKSASPAKDASAPWRIVAKVVADSAGAKLDQLEASLGDEERALKFVGDGNVRFGASPLLRAQLAARQLDADKLLAADEAADKKATTPARALPGLRNWLVSLPPLPLPADIQISAEQIMLAGRPVQTVTAELHNEANAWSIGKVDLRAPGTTHLTFKTIGIPTSVTSGFFGALDLDSADSDALLAWVQGRTESGYRGPRPLRLRGDVNVAPDRVAIDGLKAELDGGAVQGRVALINLAGDSGTRVEAALKGERLNIDGAAALARSLTAPDGTWPEAAALSLDVGRATWNGQEFRPLSVKLAYDPKSIVIDQLKFAQGGGVSTEASGRFNRTDATGQMMVSASAGALHDITTLVQPFAPALAARVDAAAGSTAASAAARVKFALDLSKDAADATYVAARAALDLNAPQLKASALWTAKPQAAALRGFDLDAIGRTEVGVETKLSAEQGSTLLALLGLDRVVVAGNGPAQLEANVSGAWRAPLKVNAKLWGTGLDGEMQGTAEPWPESGAAVPDATKASLSLRVRSANLSPLLGLKPQDPAAQNVRLFARLSLSGNKLTLDDLDSVAGGARLRGRLAVLLDGDKQVDGEVGLDAVDIPAAFALGIGAAGHDAAEPLGAGLLKGWRGRVAFQALSGALPGGGELRPATGAIKSDGQALTLENLKGKLGGGDVTATIDARPGANGLSLSGRVELSGVDGGALHYRGLRMPAGHVSAQMTLSTEGRSAQALISALAGNGTMTLDKVSIPGLDPRAFEIALHAADSGQVADDTKLRQIVEPALAAGSLGVASAQIPFIIRDGRLRVSATTLEAEGARAIVSGGYDIPADQADIRASLSSTTIGSANSQPEVSLFAAGPPDALSRSVDVTSLSSWLAVRAIDRETRRLDAIARGEPVPTYPASTASLPGARDTATPLPAEGPLPGRGPRRVDPRAKLGAPRQQGGSPAPPLSGAPGAAPPATVQPLASSQQAAPLPPPVEVRPAPGAILARPKPPRPPMVLTPSFGNP